MKIHKKIVSTAIAFMALVSSVYVAHAATYEEAPLHENEITYHEGDYIEISPFLSVNWNPTSWRRTTNPIAGRWIGMIVGEGRHAVTFASAPGIPTSINNPINVMTWIVPANTPTIVNTPAPTLAQLARFFHIPPGWEIASFNFSGGPNNPSNLLVMTNGGGSFLNNLLIVNFRQAPTPEPEPEPYSIVSITVGNDAFQVTGYANDARQVVFEMLSSQYRHIQDNRGYLTGLGNRPIILGSIVDINPSSQPLTIFLGLNTSFGQREWPNLNVGSPVGFYDGSNVFIDSSRMYDIVINLIPDENIRSITISNGLVETTGTANTLTNELVFNLTQEEFELLQGSDNWLRGYITDIDADYNLLTFFVGSSWTLGVGSAVGFLDGHTVSIQGIDRPHTIRINITD